MTTDQTYNCQILVGDVSVKGHLHVVFVVDALTRRRVRAEATKNTNVLTFQLICPVCVCVCVCVGGGGQ